MLEETKDTLTELVIELHEQARHIADPVRSLEVRRVADEISEILEREKNASRGL